MVSPCRGSLRRTRSCAPLRCTQLHIRVSCIHVNAVDAPLANPAEADKDLPSPATSPDLAPGGDAAPVAEPAIKCARRDDDGGGEGDGNGPLTPDDVAAMVPDTKAAAQVKDTML